MTTHRCHTEPWDELIRVPGLEPLPCGGVFSGLGLTGARALPTTCRFYHVETLGGGLATPRPIQVRGVAHGTAYALD